MMQKAGNSVSFIALCERLPRFAGHLSWSLMNLHADSLLALGFRLEIYHQHADRDRCGDRQSGTRRYGVNVGNHPFPAEHAVKTKTQLELLQTLRQRRVRSASSGFTLIELMIVVAVVGLLAAVALPQYLRARNRAAAGAAVGEVVGIAKECAVGNASRLAEVVRNPVTATGTPTFTCSGAAVTITGRSFAAPADGVNCVGVSASSNHQGVQITVDTAGTMTCSFT